MGSDLTVYLYLVGAATIAVMIAFARDCMTVKRARVHLKNVAAMQNVAQTHFGRPGVVTAGEILAAVRGKPEDYVVVLVGEDQNVKVQVRPRETSGSFLARWVNDNLDERKKNPGNSCGR